MEHNIDIAAKLAEGVPLADIQDVSVDQNLSREERIAEFIRQIKKSLLLQMRQIYRPGKICQGWTISGGLPEAGAALAI